LLVTSAGTTKLESVKWQGPVEAHIPYPDIHLEGLKKTEETSAMTVGYRTET